MKRNGIEPRPSISTQPGLWRVGDVLEELMGHYAAAEAASRHQISAAVPSEPGLFSTADLAIVTTSSY